MKVALSLAGTGLKCHCGTASGKCSTSTSATESPKPAKQLKKYKSKQNSIFDLCIPKLKNKAIIQIL